MAPEPCELTDLRTALRRFASPGASTQSSKHIIRLHWYVACRLVIEGGFRPEAIKPRPPLTVTEERGRALLHHDPREGGWGERIILGGLKTKKVDVSVAIPGIGPVVAVSLKGTHNAFRNLTNRMEEAAGDCTNLHISYPALVYAFWHVLRANEEADSDPIAHFALGPDNTYKSADVAITRDGKLSAGVDRLAHALERLSERDDLRDHPARYEACSLTLVDVKRDSFGEVHRAFPAPDHTLDFNRMFQRIYELYDLRFVYQAPGLDHRTRRLVWSKNSPILQETILRSPDFAEMQPRID